MDQLLNYMALFVGAILAMLSMLFETSRLVDNRVKITYVGMIFIALISLSLIVSVVNWHASEAEKFVLQQQIEGLRDEVIGGRRLVEVSDRCGGPATQQLLFQERMIANIDQCLAIVQNRSETGDLKGVMEVNSDYLQESLENILGLLEAFSPDQTE